MLVSLKPGLLDPQGKAVEGSLPAMGFDGRRRACASASTSSSTVEAPDEAAATRAGRTRWPTQVLSNPVIEDYEVLAVAAS